MERRLAAAGLKPWSDVHDADLWEPVTLRLALAGPGGREIELHEREVPGDPATRVVKDELPFLAYAPDADVEAPLVYANFGAAEDYEALRKAGVDPRGKVALVHVQGVCRGEKVAAAERAGVAALLVYLEPKDQGIVKPAYPAGSGPHPAAVSRGSLLKYFRRPGDPRRAKEQGVDVLPKIPALAISAEAAEALLREMTGPEPPKDWKGTPRRAVRARPGQGARPAHGARADRAREAAQRPRLHSGRRPEGAAGPRDGPLRRVGERRRRSRAPAPPSSSRSPTFSPASREKGWTPTRGVLFALWDGEEWGMFGSTAWVEAHLGSAGLPVAAAVNVDSGARANDLYATPHAGPERRLRRGAASRRRPRCPRQDARRFGRPARAPGILERRGAFPRLHAGPRRRSRLRPLVRRVPHALRHAGVRGEDRRSRLRPHARRSPGPSRSSPERSRPRGSSRSASARSRRSRSARSARSRRGIPARDGVAALRAEPSRRAAFGLRGRRGSWDAWARSRSGGARERARADGIAALAIGVARRAAAPSGAAACSGDRRETAGCGAVGASGPRGGRPAGRPRRRRARDRPAQRAPSRVRATISSPGEWLRRAATARKRPPASRGPGKN